VARQNRHPVKPQKGDKPLVKKINLQRPVRSLVPGRVLVQRRRPVPVVVVKRQKKPTKWKK
jgi:hypothetical protein